ncbi:DUF4439 domain-containing protein [Arthrobacter sp. NPDC089319]|uniref:DUF4439 domain-containing protein n=1 Tax=Arthrobacter sp. NPDC089319 TaxID=3155915 RepID=UPI0034476B7A
MGSTSRRRDGGPTTPSRGWWRVPLLVLTAAIVLSTGTVVASITASTPPPSITEQARVDALAGLEGLAAAFTEHDGDGSPTAALLQSQADLLTLTTSWPSGSPAAGGAGDPTAAAADSGAPSATQQPGAEDLVELAGGLLADAREADPGLARLLASIGSALYAQAQTMPGGTDVAQPWEDPEIPLEPAGCPAAAPEDDASGKATPAPPTSAEAIAAVVLSQERLVYAYESALPRLAGAERTAAAARLAAHTASAEHWRSLAAAECLDLPLPEPVYALGSEFASDPLPALRDAEDAALAPLADLVSLSDGAVREHAVAGLAEATTDLAESTGEVPPAPGLDDELPAAPSAAP